MLLSEFYLSGGRTHSPDSCSGERCCLHNPSDHKMLGWPMNLRETMLMERMCEHWVGHPDPDSVVWMTQRTGDESWGIHGCDGCCRPDASKPHEQSRGSSACKYCTDAQTQHIEALREKSNGSSRNQWRHPRRYAYAEAHREQRGASVS